MNSRVDSTFIMLIVVATFVLSLATHLFAFIYALRNRKLSSRASNYVLCALAVLATSWLIRTIVMRVLVVAYPTSAIAEFSVGLQLVGTLLFAVAIGLLVAAAFVDRKDPQSRQSEFLPGDYQAPASSGNPYSAPPDDA